MVADNIYLYHLDAEVQKLYIRGNYFGRKAVEIRQHFSNVVRIAYLLCRKELFVPLSNYLESVWAYEILNEFLYIPAYLNPLVFLSTAPNLDSAITKKASEHKEYFLSNPNFRYRDFIEKGCFLPGAFRTRKRSASADIELELIDSVADEKIWLPFQRFIVPSLSFEQFQYQLADIPRQLSGQAYISDYVLPYLSIDTQMTANADRQMNVNITRWYLMSFLTELDAVCLKDILFINSNEILPLINGKNHLSYSVYADKLQKATMKRRSIFDSPQNALNYISKCSIDDLIEFKYSQRWADICSLQEETVQKIYLLGGTSMPYSDVKIGIITALPKEYAAMKVLLDNGREASFPNEDATAGNRYFIGEINSNSGRLHKVVLCLLPKYGNNFASIISTKMMNRFQNIKNLIICGIAGGIPSKVRLGDLVVSTNGVIQYDLGSDTSDSFLPKNNPKDCSDFLLEAVQFLRAEEYEHGCTWVKYIDAINAKTHADFSRPNVSIEKVEKKTENNGEYSVNEREVSQITSSHFGKIGSGNAVQKNAKKRDALHEQHNVIAIEMESSGVSDATHLENHGYIAVRGICDYCDSQKNDEWQEYAAAVAAAYTYALIKSIPAM